MSSAFFSRRDENAVPYVTIARVEPARSCNMQVTVSQPIGFKVHWNGRAIFCPGDECPMCRTNASRFVYSLVGYVGSDRKYLELSDATVAAMRATLEAQGLADFSGTCWRFTKERRSSTIRAEFVKVQRTSLLMTLMHLRILARMFGLCDAHEGETVSQYEADLMQAARQKVQKVISALDQGGVHSKFA